MAKWQRNKEPNYDLYRAIRSFVNDIQNTKEKDDFYHFKNDMKSLNIDDEVELDLTDSSDKII